MIAAVNVLARAAAGALTWSPQGDTALMRCAEGHESSLRGCTILADGAMPYLAICMAPGCRWAARVRLEGWPGGARLPAADCT